MPGVRICLDQSATMANPRPATQHLLDTLSSTPIYLRRGLIGQALMQPIRVIEGDIAHEPALHCRNCCVVVQIQVLMLHRAPEPFNHTVVEGATASINT